eukprot:TRINITY_DN4921_c0_g1_i2.p1 TRINITY_DN4921_c0_g1~~TRINITY_DN4921_c0_g1_i2.p1  ORF type:complete len:547 (-),score=110.84 TRINITY_DN4921_c0_g1_i2:336-1976(-)
MHKQNDANDHLRTPPRSTHTNAQSNSHSSQKSPIVVSPLTHRSPGFPSKSPAVSMKESLHDRFIPNREGLAPSFLAWSPETFTKDKDQQNTTIVSNSSNPFLWVPTSSDSSAQPATIYSRALQSDLLGLSPSATHELNLSFHANTTSAQGNSLSNQATNSSAPTRTPQHLTPSPLREQTVFTPRQSIDYERSPLRIADSAAFSVSPLDQLTQDVLISPPPLSRKISKIPYKILDAPSLQDDFYLNILDWSGLNMIAVGLKDKVYFWNPITARVSQLANRANSFVTSLAWCKKGKLLAVGNHQGSVEIWDIHQEKLVETLSGPRGRVGVLSWTSTLLSAGSRDSIIHNFDIRAPKRQIQRFQGHRQEICGLRWSHDEQYLASGGNDNLLKVWTLASSEAVGSYSQHCAAIKALDWSNHQRGYLASGGGTADRTIRLWNVLTGKCIKSTDTGSQVCNLAWSKNVNEIVSTHGYSQHQITVWKCPSMSQIATLTGHQTRVLYLSVSPDGCSIVTGAGDESLRFWSVFPEGKDGPRRASSLLFSDGLSFR